MLTYYYKGKNLKFNNNEAKEFCKMQTSLAKSGLTDKLLLKNIVDLNKDESTVSKATLRTAFDLIKK